MFQLHVEAAFANQTCPLGGGRQPGAIQEYVIGDHLRIMRAMISGWGLLVASLAYVCGLFFIAWWGDRRRFYPDNVRLRPLIYSLALAVYCSSWTFYGAVGSAVRDGLGYLPIYVGPVLLFLFLLPFFERLVRMAKRAQRHFDLRSARRPVRSVARKSRSRSR